MFMVEISGTLSMIRGDMVCIIVQTITEKHFHLHTQWFMCVCCHVCCLCLAEEHDYIQ